jgi:hypothetical protein
MVVVGGGGRGRMLVVYTNLNVRGNEKWVKVSDRASWWERISEIDVSWSKFIVSCLKIWS